MPFIIIVFIIIVLPKYITIIYYICYNFFAEYWRERKAMEQTGKGLVISMSANFVLIGIFGSLLGPLALLIMEYYKITPVKFSCISTLIYIAGLSATLCILFFGDRINKIKLLYTMMGILIVALFVFSSAPPFLVILMIGAVAGFSAIMTDVTTNAIVLETFTAHKGTLIPFLYSMHDLGTVLGPIYVTLLVMPAVAATFTKPYFILGIAGIPVLAYMIYSAKKIMPQIPHAHSERKSIAHGLTVFTKPKTWLIIAAGIGVFFVYTGMVVWMPAFAHLEVGASFEVSGLTVTVFFLSAIIFRLFSPLFYKRISALKCVFLFGSIYALCTCLFVFCTNIVMLFLLIAVSGASFGLVATSKVLFASDTFKEYPSKVAAFSLMEFNIGSSVSPLLMSLIAERGSFGQAFLAIGIICAGGLAALAFGLARQRKTDSGR